ncbi:MAG: CehA/McbA family metallohydrolase [Clostridia bacterium]|nr:CehA/McbA family metallohydrolase [Clostridia bacterium]
MKISIFGEMGNFYKGNIHTHTERSDGRLPVEEVVNIYKGLGYDFLAITDHNKVFKSDAYNDGIYIIPGMEIHSRRAMEQKTHHMVALTTYDNDMVYHNQLIDNTLWTSASGSAVELAEKTSALGFMVTYCHPVWSRMDPEEYIEAGFTSLEVYNGICEYKYNHGNAEQHWDYMLRRGKKVWGIAADDCHGGENHNGRGFIMVKSDSLDDKSILSAIASGSFYSSRGPLIHDFFVEDGVATVKCSPAARIDFITYENLGKSEIYEEPVEEASFRYNPDIDYIRIEIEDSKGLKAWSNPIFIR